MRNVSVAARKSLSSLLGESKRTSLVDADMTRDVVTMDSWGEFTMP
jgi:hypothetical protein